jgi:hypothetical protein
MLGKRVKARIPAPQTTQALLTMFLEEWDNLPQELIAKANDYINTSSHVIKIKCLCHLQKNKKKGKKCLNAFFYFSYIFSLNWCRCV